ncbi:hypothetical protein GOP47_0023538 [Adiantum capillus-veneris]|uniref:Uncharacterized protein n=1 Tax=Adiantum capillus-veneris TaxID=13818 RepID=A0A9D4U3V8_ADICA|nr:hypothetical protein GOP47_0023538 [Adiantum capillus-veneris]
MPCVVDTRYDTPTDTDKLVELDEGLIESYAHDDGDAWEYVVDERITSEMMYEDVDMDEEIWSDVMPDEICYDQPMSICELGELNGSQVEPKGDP